jgi:hypothetical protein
MKKYLLFFVLLISASILLAVKVGDLPELFKPAFIQVDGDDLFITEEARPHFAVYVYSLKTKEVKFKIGRVGQGPGEFPGWAVILQIKPDSILINAHAKNIWFTRDGKFIKEEIVTTCRHARPIKDNYICWSQPSDPKTGWGVRMIHLLNSKYEKIKQIYKVQVDVAQLRSIEEAKVFPILRHYIENRIYDDKIFIADTRKGFFIDVFDSNGNRIYSIDKNDQVEKIKTTEEFKTKRINAYKKGYRRIYERIRPSIIQFYDYFPAMRSFWIDSGKIYVITYKKKDSKNELIILDLKGNILRRIFLPFKSLKDYKHFMEYDANTVHNGVLYELFENEETDIWELHKTDLASVQ